MANRIFSPLKGSLTRGVTCLTGNWLFGGSGAVTVSARGFSVGTVSASDSDPAQYRATQILTLDDKYNELLAVQITSIADADFDEDEAVAVELKEEDVSGDRTVTLRYLMNSDGFVQTQARLDGRKVLCMIWLKNSSA